MCITNREQDVVNGNMEYIRENHGLKFTASFIFCPLKDSKNIPTSVSIYANSDVKDLTKSSPVNLPKAPNRVLVQSKIDIEEPGADIAVCGAPLHAQYSKVQGTLKVII
jgi:hypothetical protein